MIFLFRADYGTLQDILFIATAAGIWTKDDDWMRSNMVGDLTRCQKEDRSSLRSSNTQQAEELVLAIVTGTGNIHNYASASVTIITTWCGTLREYFKDHVIRRTPLSVDWQGKPILAEIPSQVIKLMFDLYERDDRILRNVASKLAHDKPQSAIFGGTKV